MKKEPKESYGIRGLLVHKGVGGTICDVVLPELIAKSRCRGAGNIYMYMKSLASLNSTLQVSIALFATATTVWQVIHFSACGQD